MNKQTAILLILLTAAVFAGCSNSGSSAGKENFSKDASYALGMSIGTSLKSSMDMDGIVVNMDGFIQGFRDSITGGNMRFTFDQAGELINAAFDELTDEMYGDIIQAENTFLAENLRKPGVRTTSSGLQYEVIHETEGPKPTINDYVLVHYEGRLIDGTLFDSSYEWGEPVEFPLYAVISGWAEGLMLMSVGSEYRLYIPSDLGYGAAGIQDFIPPYSTLVFDVELLEILEIEY